MKKLLLLLILLLLPLCSCGTKKEEEKNENTSSYSSEETKPEEEPKEEETPKKEEQPINYDSGYDNLKIIDFEQTKKKILYKDTFILVVTQTSCSHCHAYKPVLNKTLEKYGILGYELDVQLLGEDEYDKALEYLDVDSTPQTLFFVKGVEKKEYRLRGEASTTKIENVIKKLKY